MPRGERLPEVGPKNMLLPWKRANRAAGRIGLSITEEGAAIAQIEAGAGGKPRLVHCRFETGSADRALTEAARALPSRALPAVSVLPSSSYHLQLLEAPDVPADELRSAVRWRIKDLIDFPIDEAVIDVFEMPRHARGGPSRMLYAVAANASLVKQHVDSLEGAGIRLDAIDIPELGLRNVAGLLEREAEGVALLYLGQGSGILLLLRRGVLYLTRRIDTGRAALDRADGMRAQLIAGLALEVRRSLDYFESHYEQNALLAVHVSGLDREDRDAFGAEVGLPLHDLDFSTFLDADCPVDDEIQRRCLPAVGAALRPDTIAP